MLHTIKLVEFCDEASLTFDEAIELIDSKFPNALIRVDSDNEESYLLEAEAAQELMNDILAEAGNEDEVPESCKNPDNEVLLIADAAASLGISNQSFNILVRKAQAAGIRLPQVIIINDGQRGRPRYGYTQEFISLLRNLLEVPKTNTLYGMNSSYTSIAPRNYNAVTDYDYASRKLIGKSDETLQSLLDSLISAGEAGATKDALANKLDISPKSLNCLLTDLQNRGYNLNVNTDTAAIETNFTADYTSRKIEWGTGGTYKIGLVSDLHACCEYTKIKSAQAIYDQFAKNGVNLVFNAGDTTHGHIDMHGSYKYEIKLRTLENQLNHLVKDYPKADGIQTFMLAGNHDLSWGRQGVDFIKLLADLREDITYLGPTVAFVDGPNDIPNFIMLYHPKDGSSYALSYKTQKIAEYVTYALRGLTDDPDIPNVMPQIASIGHYHKYVHHKGPDGSHYITCPALCGMTDFQKGKHLINEMGALMFEFGLNDSNKIDYWAIKGFDVGAGKEVLYVEEQHTSPRISISGFWKPTEKGENT